MNNALKITVLIIGILSTLPSMQASDRGALTASQAHKIQVQAARKENVSSAKFASIGFLTVATIIAGGWGGITGYRWQSWQKKLNEAKKEGRDFFILKGKNKKMTQANIDNERNWFIAAVSFAGVLLAGGDGFCLYQMWNNRASKTIPPLT